MKLKAEMRRNQGRTVDPRPFSALALVGIASLYVAVLIVAGRVW
jgi:hypothetical protein